MRSVGDGYSLDPSRLDGARKAAFPKAFRPQLATLVRDVPKGDQWLHEIKYDGYRLLWMRHGGEGRLITRNDNDWTAKFREIADVAEALPVEDVILDGEVVMLAQGGLSSFQALQNVMRAKQRGSLARPTSWCAAPSAKARACAPA